MPLLKRRQFLVRLAGLLSVVTGGLIFGRCGFLAGDDNSDRIFRSEESSGHTHQLTIPAGDMASPPSAGNTYTTTEVESHTHDVDLTMTQLQSIAAYASFTV